MTSKRRRSTWFHELSNRELLEAYEKDIEVHEEKQNKASFLETDEHFETHFRKIFGDRTKDK